MCELLGRAAFRRNLPSGDRGGRIDGSCVALLRRAPAWWTATPATEAWNPSETGTGGTPGPAGQPEPPHSPAPGRTRHSAVGVGEGLDRDDLDEEAPQRHEVSERLLVVVAGQPHLASVRGVQLRVVPDDRVNARRTAALGAADVLDVRVARGRQGERTAHCSRRCVASRGTTDWMLPGWRGLTAFASTTAT